MGRIENDMSQFSENDSSLTSQVRGETFSIDLELHAEDLPFHKWESLDYCGLPALYFLTGTKTYRPNFLVWDCINGLQSANQHCSCAGALMWSFYTHFQKAYQVRKWVQSKGRLFHSWWNGGQRFRAH